jgi:hypothetical protein
MDNAEDDTHKATPPLGDDANRAIPPLDAPVGDLHPELPEWNAALPVPESFGSDSASVDTTDSSFEETFNNIVNDRQAEESAIIESVVEEYTLEADATEAEVIDTNHCERRYYSTVEVPRSDSARWFKRR